ncbi:MAG: hypothetical protein ACKVU1_16280 [bacterium]
MRQTRRTASFERAANARSGVGNDAVVVGAAIALIALVLGIAGCGGGGGKGAGGARMTQLYGGVAADVAVLHAPTRGGGDAPARGARTSLDWLNFATRGYGPARLLHEAASSGALAESLSRHRVLIVPHGAASDTRLASACGAAIDSGLIVVVDLGAPPDENARAAWQNAAKRAAQNIIFLDRAASDRDVWDAIHAIAPLPHLAPTPFGYPRIALPVVAGDARALARLDEMPQREHLLFTACVIDPSVTIEDLEAARRARASLGAAFAATLRAPEPSDAEWRAFDATRDAMRRMGASDDERACAFAPRALAAAAHTRLASGGVRLLAVARRTYEGSVAEATDGAFDALPYQAAGNAGESLPLLVVPCDDATPLAADPAHLFDAMSGALDDSIWVTSVDTYARFWEARARSSLTSSWRENRLRVEVDARLDHLVVAIPRAAGGAVLSEILADGVSIPLGASDGDAYARVPVARGKKTLWAVYTP